MGQQTLPCTLPPPPPPPPTKRSRVGSFFSYGCLVPPKKFPQKKVDFVSDIKTSVKAEFSPTSHHMAQVIPLKSSYQGAYVKV